MSEVCLSQDDLQPDEADASCAATPALCSLDASCPQDHYSLVAKTCTEQATGAKQTAQEAAAASERAATHAIAAEAAAERAQQVVIQRRQLLEQTQGAAAAANVIHQTATATRTAQEVEAKAMLRAVKEAQHAEAAANSAAEEAAHEAAEEEPARKAAAKQAAAAAKKAAAKKKKKKKKGSSKQTEYEEFKALAEGGSVKEEQKVLRSGVQVAEVMTAYDGGADADVVELCSLGGRNYK